MSGVADLHPAVAIIDVNLTAELNKTSRLD